MGIPPALYYINYLTLHSPKALHPTLLPLLHTTERAHACVAMETNGSRELGLEVCFDWRDATCLIQLNKAERFRLK